MKVGGDKGTFTVLAGFNVQTFLPFFETQIKFFPALNVVALSFVQELFSSDVNECAGNEEDIKNDSAKSKAPTFCLNFILSH